MNKIDALVAAYNEEKTIANVINVLSETPLINRIIVVDDGSSDKTFSVVSKLASPRVILLKMKTNSGKSQAIATGLIKVTTKNVFLCDADLIKLTPKICEAIIRPVLNGHANMSIGMRNYGVTPPVISKYFHSISGERAINTDILKKCTKSKYFYNYGMETVINYYCIINHLKTAKKVFNYGHINHLSKDGSLLGFFIYLKQTFLILKIYLIFFIKGWH